MKYGLLIYVTKQFDGLFLLFFSSNDQMSIEHLFKILNAIEGLHKH